jgi:hypothetical protein
MDYSGRKRLINEIRKLSRMGDGDKFEGKNKNQGRGTGSFPKWVNCAVSRIAEKNPC